MALHAPSSGGPRLTAADPAAMAQGIRAGMSLADARAILPSLQLLPAEPEADARALAALAEWALRYTPRLALDGAHDLMLDITGCAHLFGGERALLDDLTTRLERRGLGCRAAIADRPAAAWAWARYGKGGVLECESALAELPVQALRIEEELAATLVRLGLRSIGLLDAMPRATLLTRFGRPLVQRLDALSGARSETFTPYRAPCRLAVRMAWPEPIGRTEDIEAAIAALLTSLTRALERSCEGVRRLDLRLFRLDGTARTITVRSSRPSRDPRHLRELLALELDGLDIGFGIELMRLEATETAAITKEQSDLLHGIDETALARLVDQLSTRLGPERVLRLEPVASHIPENAVRLVPAAETPALSDDESEPGWIARQPRPLRLYERPLPITAVAEVPDGPPLCLRRSSGGGSCSGENRSVRIHKAEGPERILGEWWHSDREENAPRDYFRVVDEHGRRFWVFREGLYGDAGAPRWHLHGRFD